MKINWFSPLPPAKTEIANYTKKVLPYLHNLAEITLWTDQEIWNEELETYNTVKHYHLDRMPWFELNQGDINIYHLGNNAQFHHHIWQVSRQSPGIVILHDEKLQDFFYMLSPDKNNYIQYMKECYGEEGEKNGRLFLNGHHSMTFMAENYPLTSLALENALAVMSHNRDTYLNLTSTNQWLTGYTPLPYLNDYSANFEEKQRKKPYKLIIFGFIGKNRRLDSILTALSQFRNRDSFCLDIYGELWDQDYIVSRIEELGLKKLVKIYGFVRDEELDSALTKADLAINLRYPTMGEASGSQLRLWSHGLPSLVTSVGWYGSLSPSAVAFVRFDHEIEDIHRHLQGFLDRPDYYRKMGLEGKKILERDHHPELYAKSIVNFAEMVCKYRCQSSVDRIVQRIATEIKYISPENLFPHNLTTVAENIEFLTSRREVKP